MVTRDTAWPQGVPCWIDLGADDVDRAYTFYSSLFGWEIQPGPPEAGGYAMCRAAGHIVAGIGPKQGTPEAPSVWTTYLATDDADATAERISAAGGAIVVQPMDVMTAGRMVIATDPAGAVFGVWQARAHIGAHLVDEPGTLCWNENMSRDFEGNKAFYRAVFGYEYGDMGAGGFQYATLKIDGKDVGGIGELGPDVPAEVPAHWMCYLGVADTDAAAAKVGDLGGTVRRAPWDTPYGRMAVVSDDQGAVFTLVSVQPGNGES